MVLVVMGVAGSGKTTVGRVLAQRLGWPFYDGDDFHPAGNVAKMAQGIPLNDEDRAIWLDSLRTLIAEHISRQEPAVVTCSALKRAYRERLGQGKEGILFVYLRGDEDLIRGRIQARRGHYFKKELLRSQFEILEEPDEDEAIRIDVAGDLDSLVAEIADRITAAL